MSEHSQFDGSASAHDSLLSGLDGMLREVSAAIDAEEREREPRVERRALPRRQGSCHVAVHCCNGPVTVNEQQREWLLHAAWRNGPLLDVSLRAIAFLLEQEIAIGTNVLLRVRNRSLGSRIDTVGHVELTATHQKGVKVICALAKPLCLAELDSLCWTTTDSQYV